MISQWKRTAQQNLPSLFANKADKSEAAHEAQIRELHQKIGQLTVERDFFAKAFGR